MIISLNIKSENDHYKIFKSVKIAFAKLNSDIQNTKGRPLKYSDKQIVACILYGVKSSIFILRELEYRIKQDFVFRSIIQLNQVPDYSTLSLKTKILEKHIYYGISAMFVELINSETRLCAIDCTALRRSKYDSEAKSGKCTRLGYYKGYKLHYITAVSDIIIPLVFDLTTANVYDNEVSDLLYEDKIYNLFLILADTAYDSVEWFEIASSLKFNLLTDINMRKAKSTESFACKRYENALFLQSPIGLKLYKSRLKIEQLFSVLNGLYNLENSRLYKQTRCERHIKWTLLTYLIDKFNKKQQGIKTRKYPWSI